MSAEYRWLATSPGGFLQQLAVAYLAHGYWFYVCDEIPPHKAPEKTDCKLMERYGIALSRSQRSRRKRAGLANLHYLRYQHFFVLLATHGKHRFFEEEAKVIQDVRRVPIRFAGYSISYRAGHPSVRLAEETYKNLKAEFLDVAVHRRADVLGKKFHALPFEAYAPVRSQLHAVLRAVNRERKKAGYQLLDADCLPSRRRIYRPFEWPNHGDENIPRHTQGYTGVSKDTPQARVRGFT